MGQIPSTAAKTAKDLGGDVVAQVGQLSQLCDAALCTYDEFMFQLMELNNLANTVVSQNGKKLAIGVKRGTADTLVLWRATVRIAVVEWDTVTNTALSTRLLTLPQFLRVSNTIRQQLETAARDDLPSCSSAQEKVKNRREMTLSRLFEEVDSVTCVDSLTECCICLERKPDVMLPCAHAYCLPCIEQWNTNHKTCPICRETVKTTDDAWVLTDAPECEDVQEALYSSLMNLAREPKTK